MVGRWVSFWDSLFLSGSPTSRCFNQPTKLLRWTRSTKIRSLRTGGANRFSRFHSPTFMCNAFDNVALSPAPLNNDRLSTVGWLVGWLVGWAGWSPKASGIGISSSSKLVGFCWCKQLFFLWILWIFVYYWCRVGCCEKAWHIAVFDLFLG